MKKIFLFILIACFSYAEPVIINTYCSHSFELAQNLSGYNKDKSGFELTLVVDEVAKKAYVKGNSGLQNQLILLRSTEDNMTLLEPLLTGVAVYHLSYSTKTLFISKAYEFNVVSPPHPSLITIVCKAR